MSWASMILLFSLAAGMELRAGSYSYWVAKAEKAVQSGQDEEALQGYANALHAWSKADGKKAKTKALLARVALHEKKSDWPSAVTDLSEAIALEAKSSALRHRRGQAYMRQSLLPKAMDDFYKAIALKLDFGQAYLDRGRCYELQGDAAFAKEDFRAACRLGLKEGCRKLARGKKNRARGAGKTEAAGEAPEKEADFKACLGGIERCVEQGETVESCVSATPGCPAACVSGLRRALNEERSQAEAYREFFSEDSACQKIK